MGQYSTAVSGASTSATQNTDQTFIELLPPSGVSIQLKRIRASFTGAATDVMIRIRVNRVSAAGATGTSGTIVKKRPGSPAAVTTSTIKNAASAFSVGTLVDTPLDVNVNSRGVFEWIARDEFDIIESGVNQRIAISATNSSSAVAQTMTMEADWLE